MAKYLDLNGLSTFWAKIKSHVTGKIAEITNTNVGDPSKGKTITSLSQRDGKVEATFTDIEIAESQVKDLGTHLGQKAPLDSPKLTGTPTAPTASSGTNSTQIATTAFVQAAIDTKIADTDAMVYKGVLSGGSTGSYGALTPAANKGWTYKVNAAGLIDGVAVEVGDMLICNTDSTIAATSSNWSEIKSKWDFIQSNIDGAVTGPASSVDAHVALFDGTTGKKIKDSGFTIGKNVPSNAVFTDTDTKVTSVGNHYAPDEDTSAAIDATGGTATQLPTSNSNPIQVVTGVKRDAKGHVVGVTAKALWSPNNTYSPATLGQGYGSCSTAETTVAKVVTLASYTLTTGGVVAIKFTYAVPANATMNINSKGAKSIYHKGSAITAGVIKAGDVAFFIYDGTNYHLIAIDRCASEKSIVGLSVSGKVITFTFNDGTTDTITTQDTTYTLPTASSSTKGGIKVGTGLSMSGETMSVSYGNTAGTAVEGNDARLSDSRNPTSHASTGTTYGVGTSSNYGHVKLGAANQNGATAADGVAAPNGHTHSQYSLTSHNHDGVYVKEANFITDEEIEDLE